MTPKKAKRALDTIKESEVTATTLIAPVEMVDGEVGWVDSQDGQFKVRLDGRFTADQLEAIAVWMRDPQGVAEEA